MQGVLSEAPAFSRDARKLVHLAPLWQSCSRHQSCALQQCTAAPSHQTLSVHHSFFKQTVLAHVAESTTHTFSYVAPCHHPWADFSAQIRGLPYFCRQLTGEETQSSGFSSFFRLQMLLLLWFTVFFTSYLLEGYPCEQDLILRLSHPQDHCMLNVTQFLIYTGTSCILGRGESLLLSLEGLENICWKTDVSLQSCKSFETDHMLDYISTTLLLQGFRLRFEK